MFVLVITQFAIRVHRVCSFMITCNLLITQSHLLLNASATNAIHHIFVPKIESYYCVEKNNSNSFNHLFFSNWGKRSSNMQINLSFLCAESGSYRNKYTTSGLQHV